MKLILLVLTPGKQEGKQIEVKLPQFVIGRDPQCHLRPASPMISKRHCAFIQREGKAFIRDFGSTNGTFVNEEQVQGERELHNDDHVKVGPIMFTVRIDLSAKTGQTPTPATKPVVTATPVPPTKSAPPAKASTAANDTPIPGTAAKGQDDDIMAMLMADDGTTSSPGGEPIIPEGSTVYELKVPPEVAGQNPEGKPGQTPPQAAKPAMGNTRDAAARILEKMTRRPRT